MSDARILIVEDEAIESMDIQQRLVSLGYPLPDIAYNGEEGVRKAEQTQPDLILMDIMMPGKLDGVAAAAQIRSRYDIPVIFLTAYADDNTLRRAEITGPYGYIVKPFQERELHIAVDMALYKHKMDKELNERKKWFATTLSSIGDAVIAATDENGLITFMNPIAERLTGWKMEAALGKKMTELFKILDMDTCKPVEMPIEKAIREGVKVCVANEAILIARDGTEMPIYCSVAPIKDDKGNILGVILVFRDITERKKAEEIKGRLAAIIESAEYAIIVRDLNGIIQTWNRGAENIFGYKAEEVIGKTSSLLVPPGHTDVVPAMLERIKQGEHLEHLETVRMRKDGAIIPVSMTFSAVKNAAGKIIGASNVVHDITERKKADEQIRALNEQLQSRLAELDAANKELEAFSYSASHDLRAPLRFMSGFSNILYEDYTDRLDAQGRDYLARIKKGSDQMSQLIEDLLRLSHISRQKVDLLDYDLSSLASVVMNSLREADPARNIDVVIAEGLRAVIDPNLMRIAFTNLFNNARKFTAVTGNARIEFGATVKDGKTVYFVKDNGVGFDPAYAEKMFLPFQRLHSEKEFEGTGIGLAIVVRIIRRHRGNVWAEGEVGKGATIYFTLG